MDKKKRSDLLRQFADLLQKEHLEEFKRESPILAKDQEYLEKYESVSVFPGKKYDKVDVGRSGKYMVDADGNIFGIKVYGVIHRGHRYGTLETTQDWNWGGYVAARKTSKPSRSTAEINQGEQK